MPLLRHALFAIALLAATASLAHATTQRENGRKLAAVIEAIDADDWPKAARLMANIQDEAAHVYFDWRRLRGGQGTWSEYPKFVREHEDWPGLPLLRRVGEPTIPAGRAPTEISGFFAEDAPQTGHGALRYAQALDALNRHDDARAVLIAAWTSLPMPASYRDALTGAYGAILRPHHWSRTDAMIWQGDLHSASDMLALLGPDRRKLAEARIALRRNRNGVTKLINAIPSSLKDDPGLAFDRFYWRMRRDQYGGAADLISARSTSREALGRPDVWSDRRRRLARTLMRAKDYTKAYRIASTHHLRPDEDGYTDLEWLSGYLALIYLDRPGDAVTHFRRIRQTSPTPITQGRVWYWLGRAHEAAGNADKAQEAWAVAARYQTSFYGQLAREAGNLAPQPILTGGGTPQWREAGFMASTVFRAGLLLTYAGQRYSGGRFFAHQAETMTEPEQAQVGQLLLDLNRPNMALRVAKNGAKLGRVIMPAYYPVPDYASGITNVPPELALAVIRQETEFNPEVESPAGARGLMQLMPNTARGVAGAVNETYSAERLISDPAYNIRLGTTYLRQMLDRYNGSYLLAAAAYNAGPQRADAWIARFGDPRHRAVDPVRWIEKIPFRETRNYVMRVMESVGTYRARLSGDAARVAILQDLRRGG